MRSYLCAKWFIQNFLFKYNVFGWSASASNKNPAKSLCSRSQIVTIKVQIGNNWCFSSTIAAKSFVLFRHVWINSFYTKRYNILRLLFWKHPFESSWIVPHFKWEVLTDILWLWLLSHGLITRPLPVTVSERRCGTQHGSRPADRPGSLLEPHFLFQKAPSTFLSGLPPLPWQLPPWCGRCLRL